MLMATMNSNDQDAALAHQQELEQRRQEQEMLGCAEYLKWLTKLYEAKSNEVPSESIR
jgi:hypothetical protein